MLWKLSCGLLFAISLVIASIVYLHRDLIVIMRSNLVVMLAELDCASFILLAMDFFANCCLWIKEM